MAKGSWQRPKDQAKWDAGWDFWKRSENARRIDGHKAIAGGADPVPVSDGEVACACVIASCKVAGRDCSSCPFEAASRARI